MRSGTRSSSQTEQWENPELINQGTVLDVQTIIDHLNDNAMIIILHQKIIIS